MLQRKKFKKSLFGYSKTDVSEYLNSLSEEFSKRLLEQEQYSKQEIERLQGKIEQLELDNRKLLDKQLVVAKAMLNAEKYNSYIKEVVEMEAQKLYNDIILKARHETEKLNTYKQSIRELKEMMQIVLERISSQVDSIDSEVNTIDILGFEEVIAEVNNAVIETFSERILE